MFHYHARVCVQCPTGGTMTARSGVTLKEIMARLGQSSTRAAMIYQYATSGA